MICSSEIRHVELSWISQKVKTCQLRKLKLLRSFLLVFRYWYSNIDILKAPITNMHPSSVSIFSQNKTNIHVYIYIYTIHAYNIGKEDIYSLWATECFSWIQQKYIYIQVSFIYTHMYIIYMLQRICGNRYFPESLTRSENPGNPYNEYQNKI